MDFNGKIWYSADYGTVSHPRAVTDDFGVLVPIGCQ